MGKIRTTTPEIEKGIINFMIDNPSIKHSEIIEKFNISKKVLMRIRMENDMYHGFTKHMTKEQKETLLVYMRENPMSTYEEMMNLFGYTQKQLARIRGSDNSLPSLMKVTKRKKNNSYLSPEIENEIIEYMKNNPMCSYDDILPKYNCSIRQIERLRKENNFPNIRRRAATTYQSILRKDGRRYCPKCNAVKLNKEFPPYRQSCCLECEKIRSCERIGTGNLEKFIIFKIRGTNLRKPELGNTLTLSDVLNIYENQGGKCFYSGRILALEKHNHQSLSIDRINSEKGYHKDNIVLCCSIVNYMKQEYDVDLFLDICNDITIKHPRANPQDFRV